MDHVSYVFSTLRREEGNGRPKVVEMYVCIDTFGLMEREIRLKGIIEIISKHHDIELRGYINMQHSEFDTCPFRPHSHHPVTVKNSRGISLS